ncbi:hypothetical protein B296_00058872 [Ensete ventricosum]|uniref:Uncharacterized protein n=1 Tax=Ensete ventricosum TaxID=4639 RepID=A0A426WVH8_ENSVE|nr:hypothetical protein B296_00058872 [Ensete ventricosum]
MHPLRFPNNGIKTKRRQRGGGATNHGQPQGPTTHGQAGCKVQSAAAKDPYKGAIGHGQSPLARAAASMNSRPREWLAPVGAMPTGVGNANSQAAWGSRPRPGRKGQPRGQGCRL